MFYFTSTKVLKQTQLRRLHLAELNLERINAGSWLLVMFFAVSEEVLLVAFHSHGVRSQRLLVFGVAFVKVFDDVAALNFSLVCAVSLDAFQHLHFHLSALVVMLGIDQCTGQIGERRTEEWSHTGLSHPTRKM